MTSKAIRPYSEFHATEIARRVCASALREHHDAHPPLSVEDIRELVRAEVEDAWLKHFVERRARSWWKRLLDP